MVLQSNARPRSPGAAARALAALAYLALGALGLSLAIPPGFASPVFPAAGFALALALLWGGRAAPVIWAGSFALNAGRAALDGGLALGPLGAAALVGAGAALQAQAGAWLVRRNARIDWRALDNERAILGFLLRGGVAACLVAPSIAVPALQLAGVMEPGAGAFNWWNWYTGDLIGVVIFAPLTLLAVGSGHPLWRERRWRVGLPIVGALVLAMVAFATAMRWERGQEAQRLREDGEALARLVRSRLIAHREILSSLRHFVEATPGFNHPQFEAFTRRTLADNPDIFALSFNDLVAGADLPAYQERVRAISPVEGFTVTERDASRRLLPAQPRPRHVVVRFIVPLQGNLPALGFDIQSDPVRADAIDRSLRSGQMAVTAPVRLVQEDRVRMGVLALHPVHLDARQSPSGFAVAVIKVDELVQIALRGHVPPELRLTVRDPAAPAGADLFYESHPGAGSAPAVMQWQAPLAIGDRQWELTVAAPEAYLASHRSWVAWAVGVIGLVFAGLLQVSLLGLTGRTVTIRRQNETLVANQAELLLADTVFQNAGEAVVVVDRDAVIVSANPAFGRIAGHDPLRVRGQPLALLLEAGDDPRGFGAQAWQELAAGRQWQGEWTNLRGDGQAYPAWWTVTAVRDAAGAPSLYVGTFSDISEQQRARQQIEFLAYHDALTGLPNRVMGRRRAVDAISHARRQGAQVAVMFLDLDQFKLVNDTHGHSVGDLLLQQVAGRLAANLRGSDGLCRLSGDEFMVVLEDVEGPAQVVAVCEKVLGQLVRPFECDGRLVQISVSVGVAMFPADGDDPETLLRNADTALFQAKQAGRNTYRMFDAYMNADVVRFVTIRDELVLALERGEFELHYQPQVSLQDGTVRGVEALLRWQSPARGMVSPRDFIPVAEESGLVAPIGEWVLRQACRQMAHWRAQGLDVGAVAVNVSAVQLRRPGLEAVLAQVLQETGLPAACVELELTESMLVHDHEQTLEVLERLRGLGVRLAIDDFGTGYSSLSYLKRLKVRKLKIDQSFAADAARDPDDAAIARAIVSMARGLGLQTVAEGVETEAAAQALRAMGCDQAQGYLYARPMPADRFLAWWRGRPGG